MYGPVVIAGPKKKREPYFQKPKPIREYDRMRATADLLEKGIRDDMVIKAAVELLREGADAIESEWG